jgi:hypothetical protein
MFPLEVRLVGEQRRINGVAVKSTVRLLGYEVSL